MFARILASAVLSGLILLPIIPVSAKESLKTFIYTPKETHRPANFYRIKKSLDNKLCPAILAKLNEPHKQAAYPLNFNIDLFTGNSASAKWDVKQIENAPGSIFDYVHHFSYHSRNSDLEHSFLRLYSSPGVGENRLEISMNTNAWKRDEKHFPFKEVDSLIYTNEGYHSLLDLGEEYSLQKIFSGFAWPIYKEQDLMLLTQPNEELIGLMVESNPEGFCGKHYQIIASLDPANGKRFSPICQFVSIPKIICKQ